ncbi:PAS domain-containing sensor histidine kinase [Spirosoma pollinicola]|uniref:histidine kinase n=1 Tax=Spirosoma pollinicola TaxID=2057025 RepID=A0A2K8ZAJ7_9BACT|nr:PAS domain-containing protein [Spirosoma pollinicola]AUD06849.1 PAS domain-containing sensor histidine kinase [Spirosoma pollinicola]
MTGDQQPFNFSTNLTQRLNVDLALEAAGLGIWEFDLVTGGINWDERCRALYGFTQDTQIAYEKFIECVHPDDIILLGEELQRLAALGSNGRYDVTYRVNTIQDGRLRWIRSYGQATFAKSGELIRFAGVAQDITPQILAQQQLEQTQQQLVRLFEEAPVGIASISGDDLRFRSANPYYGDIIGRSPQQLIGKTLFDAIPEVQGQGFDERLRQVIATGQSLTAQEVPAQLNRHGRLETAYVNFTYQLQRPNDSHSSDVLMIATDVTLQVLARQQLEESEARFRFLIEEAPIATCLFVGRELRIEVANERMIQVWGKGAGVLGVPLADALPELRDQHFLTTIDEVFTTGEPFSTKAGRADLVIEGQLQTFYFDYDFKALRNADDQVYAIMEMATDVTAQVVTRQALEASEAFARDLLYSSPVANLVFVGPEMVINTINEGMLAMLGRDKSIIGQPFMKAMPELIDTPLMDRLHHVLTTGETFHQPEERIDLIRQGEPYTGFYHYIYTALRDKLGKPTGVVVTAIEVTTQVLARQAVEESEARYRRLSEELDLQVQARTEELETTNEELEATNEELAANNEELTASSEEVIAINLHLEESNLHLTRSNENLEQFAYIASHDLQEPLRKIQQFGDLLKTRYVGSAGDELLYLERMQGAASRMSLLIKDLLTFSRISTSQVMTRPVLLSEVISQVVDDLSVAIEESGAQIQVDTLPTVQGDRSQLSQLFQNLLSNAVKFRHRATAGQVVTPRISVRSSVVLRHELPALLQVPRYAEAYHRIEVADNGIGFDEKYADRIFQVFQRLHGKNEFAGTGIGLAVVQKVVTNHGGTITASSQPGKGATFCVYLPL